MPATITVVNGRTVISAGENTLEAARQAAIATEKAAQSASARDAAIAFLNPYPDQAAGEAATADGDLFSFRDGDDMVALAKRKHARAGGGFDPLLAPLVEHALDGTRDHVPMQIETRRHGEPSPNSAEQAFIMLPNCLRIGSSPRNQV